MKAKWIVCFSDDEELLKKVKEQLSSLPQEKIPFFVFVKTNQFSQNIVEYRKIKKINVIKYFGQSREDINESNTLKTAEIFKSTILQIEGYYNERGTLYRNYLFGYLNNINNLEHIESNNNIQIEEMMSGARSTLNIFLFGQARAGKSRFINLSMNEKIAYEDYSAGSITTKFTRYELPMNNNNNGELGQIVFYDAPGNNDKNYKEYNKALEQTLDLLKERKENSSILLYFIKKDGNGLTNIALNFIKFLDEKFKIFFIITHSKRNIKTSKDYRDSVIDILSTNNVLTGYNLKMLNKDNGYNVINVNLKEDDEHGEFYGFQEIYEKIYNLFPKRFPEIIDEGLNNCENIDQLMGYINYRNFFFLENCRTIEDFFANINSKINERINIGALVSSSAGLIPIPFADVPVILATQALLIKYIVKLYGIKENEYSSIKLSTLGPNGSWSALGWNLTSKICFVFTLLDLIPFVGFIISAGANPLAIKSFGNSLKSHFLKIVKDNNRVFNLIQNVLKDYKYIYSQIHELSIKENNSFEVDD